MRRIHNADPEAPIELVVARFREDLRWTRKVPREIRITLYDKSGEPGDREYSWLERRELENVGLEAHTYLYHVVTHYSQLAPVTVFAQGYPFDHAHDFHHVLRGLVAGTEKVDGFRWLGFIIDSDDPRGRRLFVPWSKNRDGRELDLDGFSRKLLGEPVAPWTHFYPGGQFLLTQEQIHSRSRHFYANALSLALSFPDAACCFERLWDRTFGAVGVDPDLLKGGLCRYLKPIRRLMDEGNGK
jgi:hypothetical protein